MPIVYTKLFELLKEKGYTTYKIRQEVDRTGNFNRHQERHRWP
jgi:hypothetical protein